MQVKICVVIFVLLIIVPAVLQAKRFYSDCSKDNTLIDASMSSCDGAHCIIDGGTFVNFKITFQARRNIRAGKAKFCISDSQLWLCLKQIAYVTDICDNMEQKCPLKRGGVYTYNNSFFAPDVSMEGKLSYKLYDEKCNVLACTQYKGGIRSQNKDIQLQFFTDDSYPCGDK